MLETILSREGELVLLEQHLERMRSSQLFLGYTWNQKSVEDALKEATDAQNRFSAKFAKVRLLVSHDGSAVAEFSPLECEGWRNGGIHFKISKERTDSKDLFLYHKTTNRDFYNNQYRNAVGEGMDEVVFMNEKNEITEGAITNIFVGKNERWHTPPVKCGLLPGVWRAQLIDGLNAIEEKLYIEDIKNSEDIILCNSLRGAVKAEYFEAK